MRGVLVGYINEKVDKYPEGSILMDALRHSSAPPPAYAAVAPPTGRRGRT